MQYYSNFINRCDLRWIEPKNPKNVVLGTPIKFLCVCRNEYISTYVSNYCPKCRLKILNKIKRFILEITNFKNVTIEENKIIINDFMIFIIVDFVQNNKIIINRKEMKIYNGRGIRFIRITENCMVNDPNWKTRIRKGLVNVVEKNVNLFIDKVSNEDFSCGIYNLIVNFVPNWKVKDKKLLLELLKKFKT